MVVRRKIHHAANCERQVFEVFLQQGFCELELASVLSTLQAANKAQQKLSFAWHIVSDTPGLVEGSNHLIVRAEPSIRDHNIRDYLIVIGRKLADETQWLARVRLMRRLGRPVVLLADAATTYISLAKKPSGKVTTHWADMLSLRETGCCFGLSNALSECSDGIITAAGRAATAELVLGLLARTLPSVVINEVARTLMLGAIRRSSDLQPSQATDFSRLHDPIILEALSMMEQNLDDPLSILEIAEIVGVSQRQLERQFGDALSTSPARYYREIRVKHARTLITDTNLSLTEIAFATGFVTVNSLAKNFKRVFDCTPSQFMKRARSKILDYNI
jgi:transcriptional regulator GlxA family with amidase domain